MFTVPAGPASSALVPSPCRGGVNAHCVAAGTLARGDSDWETSPCFRLLQAAARRPRFSGWRPSAPQPVRLPPPRVQSPAGPPTSPSGSPGSTLPAPLAAAALLLSLTCPPPPACPPGSAEGPLRTWDLLDAPLGSTFFFFF